MRREIKPQPGPQTEILRTSADIGIYGGAAGGGKSWAIIAEPLRHAAKRDFGAVIFRRTYPEITNQGGLWDEARKWYPELGGKSNESDLSYTFPTGMSVSFRHLENDADVHRYQGSQIPLIEFDELTTFTEYQFYYLLSRNRSTTGIPGYVRASCNPDADSWVAKLISWWIDPDTGFPIPERSAVVRWMIRRDPETLWFDTKREAVEFARTLPIRDDLGNVTDSEYENALQFIPKSVTFIPARLSDNRELTKADPGYLANLMAQDLVERERLLHGNWKIRPASGLMFPRDKWIRRRSLPEFTALCRFWDKAATEGGKGSRTAGVLVGITTDRQIAVVHAKVGRWGDIERERIIQQTTSADNERWGHIYAVGMEQEPGSAGKVDALMTLRTLAGMNVLPPERATGTKPDRWRPFARQVQAGNCLIIDVGNWDVEGYITELDALAGDEDLDERKLKDLADASAGAFKVVAEANWTYKVNRPAAYDPNGFSMALPHVKPSTDLPDLMLPDNNRSAIDAEREEFLKTLVRDE